MRKLKLYMETHGFGLLKQLLYGEEKGNPFAGGRP